jgi:hypothetical protein
VTQSVEINVPKVDELLAQTASAAVVHTPEFRFSELAASDLLLRTDIAEFVTSSALLVGPERSVQCTVDVLGEESASAATRRMQGAALSGATKNALRERDDDLLGQIRAEITIATGRETPPLDRITRLRPAPNHHRSERTNGEAP